MEYLLIVNCENVEEIGNIVYSNRDYVYKNFTNYNIKILSPMEYHYYSNIVKNKRAKLYNSDFFNKLKNLRFDDICSVEINGISIICKMKKKIFTENKILFTFEANVFNLIKILNY